MSRPCRLAGRSLSNCMILSVVFFRCQSLKSGRAHLVAIRMFGASSEPGTEIASRASAALSYRSTAS
jgi:hypothetical protein